MRMKRPTVTITTAITERAAPADHETWITTPSTNAIASVAKNASQYERPQT